MSKSIPTEDEFLAAFPQFASVPSPSIIFQLSLSSRLLSDRWGDFLSDAILLDTAHNLTILQNNGDSPGGGIQGAVGTINNVSAAGISTSFNSMQISDDNRTDSWYSKTSYGQQFMRLRDSVFAPGIMVN